jgi:hypothetical protein
MNVRAVLAGAGRTLVIVLSVTFFAATAFAMVVTVGYALFQSSPIWTPIVVESAAESELELTDEGEE